MSAKLVAEEGELKGLVLSLDEGDHWVIGRDPDACQLLIEDSTVSRKQAICRATSEGITIEDVSETNPIKINAEPLDEPKLLQNGDALKIGSGIFRFYVDTSAQVIDEEVNGSQEIVKEKGTQMDKAYREDLQEDNAGRQDSIFDDENPYEHKVLAEIDFNVMDTGRWLMKVIAGPNNGAEFSMNPSSSFLIGTDPNTCDIVFHDTSVSRQHARLTISPNDELTIEDLKSRNGTLVDGEPLIGSKPLPPNVVIVVGTTAFIVFNREGDMQTVISPLLPSIVRSLKKEEEKKAEAPPPTAPEPIIQEVIKEVFVDKPQKHVTALGAFIITGIIAGLFIIVGLGTYTLFKSEPIVVEQPVDTTKKIEEALALFPSVRPSFNKSTGRLLLIGHVLSANDRNQILANLQGMNFIKSVDDSGVVIDEYVRQEVVPLINRTPKWKGVNIQSPSAGHFVLFGYLANRKDMEQLTDYVSQIFPYMDLLEYKVVNEEDLSNSVNTLLARSGIKTVKVQINNGDVNLGGGVPSGKEEDFNAVLADIKQLTGVRNVNNLATSLAPEKSMIDLTDKYEVTGVSSLGGNLSVVINGRILTKNDMLDGMTIAEIKPNAIFLEKDAVKYRIEFGR